MQRCPAHLWVFVVETGEQRGLRLVGQGEVVEQSATAPSHPPVRIAHAAERGCAQLVRGEGLEEIERAKGLVDRPQHRDPASHALRRRR